MPLIPGWYNAVARIAHWQTSARWEYDNSVNDEMYWQSLHVVERGPHLICLKRTSLKGWPWLGWHWHQLLHKSRYLLFTFTFYFRNHNMKSPGDYFSLFTFTFNLYAVTIWKECVFQCTRHSTFRGGKDNRNGQKQWQFCSLCSFSGSTEEHCFTTEGIFDPLAGMPSKFKVFKSSSHHYW